ncbi:Hypothetical protein ACI5QL_03208 [Bacillus velezensis]
MFLWSFEPKINLSNILIFVYTFIFQIKLLKKELVIMKRKAAACIGIFCSIIAGTFIADDFCKTRQQTEADNWERFFLGAEYAEVKLSAAESMQTPFRPREYIRIVYR